MRGAILAVFAALPAICALIAALSVLPGCDGCAKFMRKRDAIDRCILGILEDPILKQQSDMVGGASARELVCKTAVEKSGVDAPHRQDVENFLATLVIQRAVQQQSW